jgi:glycine/D-amino acid oxidase-like deaminating enzyme
MPPGSSSGDGHVRRDRRRSRDAWFGPAAALSRRGLHALGLERFIIDRHPAADGVAFASACSGHGFNLAPVIGDILADLVTTGSTVWEINAFRAGRFGSN